MYVGVVTTVGMYVAPGRFQCRRAVYTSQLHAPHRRGPAWSARARNIVASRLLVRSTHPRSIRVMLMHDDFDALVPQPVGGLLLYPPIATNQRCLHSSHTPTPTMVLGRIQAPRSRVTWSPARGRHQPIAGLQLHDPIHRQVASSEGF